MVILAIIGLIAVYLFATWAMYFVPGWVLLTLLGLAYGRVFLWPIFRTLWEDHHVPPHH